MAIVGAAALGTSSARGQADDGKKFVIVRTIGELKTTGVSSTVQLVALVLGYSSVNDGGEGFFVWDPFNAQPANGGTVFASTASPTGRWLRLSV